VTKMRALLLAVALVQTCSPANLSISTYFKDGFTPTAIASDAQGNVFIAGNAIVDPASRATAAAVAKLDSKASQYVYLTYLDAAASDQVSAIAVDGAGNAYIAGWTTNSNFPVTAGGPPATLPANQGDWRSFIAKLSPDGAVMYSVLIGGSAASRAMGIAITPWGQILVSGIAATGFPSTPGAYSVANTNGNWFLMELDSAASTVVFSATGIGGSSMAFDTAGNIFLAGSGGVDYPTTPGAYQTTFMQSKPCFGICAIVLQHVTKVDPSGSKLIYSTGLNDPVGGISNNSTTTNTGLAVDAAGNVFVTGTLYQAAYPLTVPAPSTYSGYLTKLDPTGSSVLFSIPVGGGGVKLDSSGTVYVSGAVSPPVPVQTGPGGVPDLPIGPVAPPAAFSWVPQPCWPNNVVASSEAYLMKLDPATGNVLDEQWINGSGPGAVGITLAGGMVWTTGATLAADVPFTPGALSPSNLGTGFLPGAYLAAVDFSASAAGAPVIACALDAANLSHLRAVAAFQVISLFGTNLGPSTGVVAPDGTDPSIAGVTVTFDGNPAPMLYVSSSQINVVVPSPASFDDLSQPFTVMQVTVNGAIVQRQLPFASSNLNLFTNLSSYAACPSTAIFGNGFQPLATNADGSLNTCANPAQYGSTVSLLVHGVGVYNYASPPPPQLLGLQAMVDGCSAAVGNAPQVDGFLYKADVRLPDSLQPCATSYGGSSEQAFFVTLSYGGAAVGPLSLSSPNPMGMIVWVKP
jgi:uncharacterized protein (TIGR03437 family)